jgi:hypothetical protein
MGSPVARLSEGRVSPSALSDSGLIQPLLEALRTEAEGRPGAVRRVVIYAADGVPRETLGAIRKTVAAAELGPGMILPWRAMLETQAAEEAGPRGGDEGKREQEVGPPPSREFPVVVRATRQGVWLNGERIGRLEGGRLPLKGARGGESGFELPRLKEKFAAVVEGLPMERWRLLLVVTPDVERSVVQRLLSAAGQVGITKFRLHRTLGGEGR